MVCSGGLLSYRNVESVALRNFEIQAVGISWARKNDVPASSKESRSWK